MCSGWRNMGSQSILSSSPERRLGSTERNHSRSMLKYCHRYKTRGVPLDGDSLPWTEYCWVWEGGACSPEDSLPWRDCPMIDSALCPPVDSLPWRDSSTIGWTTHWRSTTWWPRQMPWRGDHAYFWRLWGSLRDQGLNIPTGRFGHEWKREILFATTCHQCHQEGVCMA